MDASYKISSDLHAHTNKHNKLVFFLENSLWNRWPETWSLRSFTDPGPGRGCRDSGQPEITGTRGGGGGYYRQWWAGLGMQQEVEGGRAI